MKFLSFNGKIKKTMLLIPLLAMSVFPSITSAESVSNEELAKQSIKNYVEAATSGDASEATKWVIDTRFDNEQEQLKGYKESLKDNPFSDASIKEVVSASDATYKATVELTRKDDGSINTVTYPIIKKGDSWKVLINGQQETRSKKVEKLIQSQSQLKKNESAIKPSAVELTSYGDDLVKSGDHIYSNQKFNMTTSSVGIQGWQQIMGSVSEMSVKYSVVDRGVFSDDEFGRTIHHGFNYWNGASFYETVNTGGQRVGVYLKITDLDSNTVRVRGHVYGN
ncbi:hypothetical protein [Paenibacillus polymyxa]|uniref:hypothetical protein n=1 Tax=Paenibacillus polymyxa TaxID=1406 RepID=UPI0025B70445|nr:hypothetical protein [Paenibacillus polymyxa]MDN4090965.1 hypothetical protein [Paenibacillus polymyxa]